MQCLPIFLLGALFVQLMADSEAANTMARCIVKRLGPQHALVTTQIACGLLTYGGVSLFVGALVIYPIARDLFTAANIPKRFILATMAFDLFTFTMTAMSGTSAIQNAIPISYYETNFFTAARLGLIGSAIMLLEALGWRQSRVNKTKAAGKEDGGHESNQHIPMDDGSTVYATVPLSTMPLFLAFLPLLLVIGINALFTYWIFSSSGLFCV